MSLKDQLDRDYIEAYKSHDALKVSVLRMLKSSIKNFEINEKRPTEDSDILKLLKKESKQRQDSIQEYQKAGRADLIEKESDELALISIYLPEELEQSKIIEIIDSTIDEIGANSLADFGKVMPKVMAKINGAADGSTVAELVRQKLQK